jgi:nucleotide-binding universal stress UspA family protein
MFIVGLIVMFEKIRILVGVDGSVQSKKALKEAISLAQHFSGFINAITVYEKGQEKKAQAVIDDAKHLLEGEGVKFDVSMVVGSNIAKILEGYAKKENFELIVVGSRGLGSRVSILLGSVSKQVVGNAYCNVLVVKK